MQMYRHLNVLVDGNLFVAVKKHSQKLDIPISQLVRTALEDYLRGEKKQKVDTAKE